MGFCLDRVVCPGLYSSSAAPATFPPLPGFSFPKTIGGNENDDAVDVVAELLLPLLKQMLETAVAAAIGSRTVCLHLLLAAPVPLMRSVALFEEKTEPELELPLWFEPLRHEIEPLRTEPLGLAAPERHSTETKNSD